MDWIAILLYLTDFWVPFEGITRAPGVALLDLDMRPGAGAKEEMVF